MEILDKTKIAKEYIAKYPKLTRPELTKLINKDGYEMSYSHVCRAYVEVNGKMEGNLPFKDRHRELYEDLKANYKINDNPRKWYALKHKVQAGVVARMLQEYHLTKRQYKGSRSVGAKRVRKKINLPSFPTKIEFDIKEKDIVDIEIERVKEKVEVVQKTNRLIVVKRQEGYIESFNYLDFKKIIC